MATFAGKHLVSLCVIARDEEHNLPRLLASAQAYVAEAIVVDTGSRDGTVASARALGARVVEHPWEHSFAIARNHSLELAQTPWALVLDADEQLVVTDDEGFARALSTVGEPLAYAVECHDLRDDGSLAVAPLLRLFRRDREGMRFTGNVHEQLIEVARGRVQVARATFLHFRHDGHTTAALAGKDKHARNLNLARQQLKAQPEEPFAWFCLAQALATTGAASQLEEAATAYGEALARLDHAADGEAFVVSLFVNLAVLQLELGRREAAASTLQAGLSRFPASPDLRFLRARVRMAAHELARAEEDLRACLRPEAARFFVRLDPAASGHRARTQLGVCLIKQGRLDEALEHLEAAVREAPAGEDLARTLLEKVKSVRTRP